jgi:hypothetical protein
MKRQEQAMRRIVMIALIAAFSAYTAYRADSPVTSTPFHGAYPGVPEVQEAAESGELTYELAVYLMDEETPLDRAAAVINALSWSIDGKDNAEWFLQYLRKIDPEAEKSLSRGDASGRLWFVLGYLEAMDGYFDVAEAERKLSRAVEELPGSFTVAMIHSLLYAQEAEWCAAYLAVAGIMERFPEHRDMKAGAVDIIMDYMIAYAEFCTEHPEPEEPEASPVPAGSDYDG